ncbi:c-1-tetrahydrofolate synthase cytoplasmic-related [Holotrichia oblita]|nr:c-1-tetrahydrofolate synthase cytoplasmic-related [Holotrichia oblita]
MRKKYLNRGLDEFDNFSYHIALTDKNKLYGTARFYKKDGALILDNIAVKDGAKEHYELLFKALLLKASSIECKYIEVKADREKEFYLKFNFDETLKEKHMTDLEIASKAKIKPVTEICKDAGFDAEYLEQYGKYKGKLNIPKLSPKGKIILVTAINPTSMGEGKTTMSIGIADGIRKLNKKVILALREPSLGPVFGVKGGAAGGGYSQVVPMEDINLHFTGDLHAITAANNLLAAGIDNHIFQGNALKINPVKIQWRRCLDMNDRALRNIVCGLGGEKDGIPRADGFDITAASEIMAILCLSNSLKDLKQKLGNITVAYNYEDKPVYARDLNVEESLAVLLKEAIKPNLVQTLEGTPALVHGGAVCQYSSRMQQYNRNENGGDIRRLCSNLSPSAVVIVATVKALKLGGGADAKTLNIENINALKLGIKNLEKHIENITKVFNLPCVKTCDKYKVDSFEVTSYLEGGNGALKIAEKVTELCDKFSGKTNFTYELSDTIENKIEAIVKKIYGGGAVKYSEKIKKQIQRINDSGFSNLPVVIAKTQYSLSDNPKLLGRPEGFEFTVSDIKLKSGAGFIVAVAGDMMLMPGLPKVPAANSIEITDDGVVSGLF